MTATKHHPYFIAGRVTRVFSYVAIAGIAFGLGRVYDSVVPQFGMSPVSNTVPVIQVPESIASPEVPKQHDDKMAAEREVNGGLIVAPNKNDGKMALKQTYDRLVGDQEVIAGESIATGESSSQTLSKAIEPSYPIPQIVLKERRQDGDWRYPEVTAKDVPYHNDAMPDDLFTQLAEPSAPVERARYRMSLMLWKCGVKPQESVATINVKFKLNSDGSLNGEPIAEGGKAGGVEQKSAVDKIKSCAPYRWFPKNEFEVWREMNWTFAPKFKQ